LISRQGDSEIPDHFLDWLQCLRTRKTTNVPIEAGYYHCVPALMGVRAMDTGKRQVFDPQTRQIREGERRSGKSWGGGR
jgi:hypothetical protein